MDLLRSDLVDMARDQRRGLARALGILGALFLVAAGSCWALAVHVRPLAPPWLDSLLSVALVLLGIVAVSLGGVVVWLLTWMPRMLTRQGVVVGADGLLLFQDAKWWFAGRRLHVPWPALAEVSDHRPGGLGDRRGLVLSVHDLAPGARAPGWVLTVPAGGTPPEGEDQSDRDRLYLTLPASGADELARLIDRRRRASRREGTGADMSSVAGRRAGSVVDPVAVTGAGWERDRTDVHRPAVGSTVGSAGSETDGTGAALGTAFSPGADGPSARGTWLPVRGQRILAWGVFPVALVGTPLIVLVSFVRGSDTGWDSASPLVLTAVVAVGALVSAVLLPWYWAPQGVSGDEHGIAVRRESMWWARSGGIFVPWADVRGVVTHTRAWEGAEEAWGLPVVEIVVDRLDSAARPPRWVRTVPAGAQGWGTVADRPRLGITVSEPNLARRIELLVHRARPGLAAGSAPSSAAGPGLALAPAESGAGAAPARSVIQAPDFRSDQWITVPRRGLEWVLAAVGVLAGVAILAVLDIGNDHWLPALAPVPGAATAAHAAIALACGAALVWMAAVTLPRRCAGSGIRLTDDGLELVRQDLWWSRGSRVALPWARVRAVRGSRGLLVPAFPSARPAWGAVDLVVEAGRAPQGLPHWARARGTGEPGTVRLRLVIGDQGRRRLLAAARPGAPERT
ncbi:hypothetical protein [Nocardiopsis sp. Huas11]|uniref:hypothetical protein n=1 Tax=Nocardiopsis sp. Huas11 TaxID=2183912 RepID=UPI000EB2CA87|nr:hypothetical protein [Nocardiopsis sp. Huas11]